jgi:thiol-disulfide isomerase/thioredoxin
MKRHLISFSLLLVMFSHAYSQDLKKFTLQGSIDNKATGKLYLIYLLEGKKTIDSTKIQNGKFVFYGSIDEPVKAELTDDLKMRREEYSNYFSNFYIESGQMNLALINNQFAKAKLTGSKTNDDYHLFSRDVDPIFDRIFSLKRLIESDSLNANQYLDSLAYYNAKAKEVLFSFIKRDRGSFVAISAVQRLGWCKGISVDSALTIFNSLDQRVKNSSTAQKLRDAYINEINSSVGHIASDFERKDVIGKTIRLSSFRGRYVLLEFWASWCVPCIAQMPHIKALNEKYNSKGLDVIAISCDSKYDLWQKAVQKYNVEPFVNILSFTEADMSFLKTRKNDREASFKGELRKQFNLMPIPVTILIDPNGIIAGRYGGTEKEPLDMIDKKLAEIFDASNN